MAAQGGGAVGPPRRAALVRGVRDGLAIPALIVFGGMAGFGSLARDAGLDVWQAVAASAAVWGLPGQVVMAELYGAGADLLVIVIAVSLANARFLPLAVSFLPMLGPERRRGLDFAWAQLLSVNTWAVCRRSFPGLAAGERVPYFAGLALTCFVVGIAGTAAGALGAAMLPRALALALVFLNPVFFALVLIDVRGRPLMVATIAGAALGPPLHLLSPDWGLLAAGVVAGTGAFLVTHRGSP